MALANLRQGNVIDGYRTMNYRAALVSRHMNDVQKALEEIRKVAKDRGYKEIVEIFDRAYHCGHSEENVASASS